MYINLEDSSNYSYLTYIERKNEKNLVIIDNIVNGDVFIYDLDIINQSELDSAWFLSIANSWYYSHSEQYPLSFEFNRLGMTELVKPLYKSYPMNAITKIIGRIFSYDLAAKPKMKRRKIKFVAAPEYEIDFSKGRK
jgi:hypothetical protein